MPENPMGRFVVFRLVNDDGWYYGDWFNYENALEVAVKINGQIIPTEYVEV
jgi:hypothetical protein